jgi:queuosine precursor transporter
MQPKILIGMYLAAIVAANLAVAAFGPAITIVNAFVFIAFDLVARDRLHEAWQRRGLLWKMGSLIAAGSVVSYLLNANAGPIALASFVAFAVSAALDALVYWALGERAYMVKVNGSNIVGAAADSLIFPTLAFGAVLPLVILGQFAAKCLGGFIWAFVLQPRNRKVAL